MKCIFLTCLLYLSKLSNIFVYRCEGSLTPSPGCQKSPKDHLQGSLPPPRPLSSPDAHISIISTDTEKKMRNNGKVFFFQQPPQFLLPAEPHKSADELKAFTTTTTNFSQADLKTRSNPVYTWIYKTFEPN